MGSQRERGHDLYVTARSTIADPDTEIEPDVLCLELIE